jgi:helicase
MMAEIESWESATEFGIPEDLWAGYQVRQRSDDLYIAVLSEVFNTFRVDNIDEQRNQLSELANTLLIYSRSTAAQYISGVDRTINLIYCAAIFYIAGFPATASLIAKKIDSLESLLEEEIFLLNLLSRNLNEENELELNLINQIKTEGIINFEGLLSHFQAKTREGLESDPRLFISSALSEKCLQRFSEYNIWDSLAGNAANYSYELWQPFFNNSDSFPLWELFPSQITAIESGILSDSNNVYSMQMPTSSGKTSLCEILIYNEVKGRGKRVLFLVPFRALASEIKEGISKRLESADVTVVSSHGGNIPTKSDSANAETTDVLIITPEKYSAIIHNMPELADAFDTIICDEGHLIDDSSRGLQYELLLTKLKGSDENPKKVIFISAILPNVDTIHSWLGGSPETLAQSNYKPVETDFAFIALQDNNSWQLAFNTIYERPRSYFLRSFLTKDDLKFENPATGNMKLISGSSNYTSLACAAAVKAQKTGPVALFTTQKGNNGVSGLTKKMLELYENDTVVTYNSPELSVNLPSLIEYITVQFGEAYSLTQLLNYGIGYHHGDLPQDIRREMEAAIQDGLITILICTSTLAEGVNLPIRTLVMHTIKRFNGTTTSPIENRSIKNIVGRVGRAGKETRGRIIFANNTERQIVENVFRDNAMESAEGALFQLVSVINYALSVNNIQLSNELFESQNISFLSTLDKIDSTLIDLLSTDMPFEEMESYIESTIEDTLAYQYCTTDDLQNRIKEIFVLRTQHIQAEVPQENWPALRQSGSSPRFWKFVRDKDLINRPEWLNLEHSNDNEWITNVILKIIEMPTLEINEEPEIIRNTILGWMNGLTYHEIAALTGSEIEDTLKLLSNTIGFKLQEGIAQLTQLAIATHGTENISEWATSWSLLLQYGLTDLHQLDLFERGASDRLAVWGISRYLNQNDISERGFPLIRLLRLKSEQLTQYLKADNRVPQLSIDRIMDELGL